MKNLLLVLVLSFGFSLLNGQSPLKQITDKPHGDPKPIVLNKDLPTTITTSREASPVNFKSIPSIRSSHEDIESLKVSSSGSFWVSLKPNELWNTRSSVTDLIGALIPESVKSGENILSWNTLSETRDEKNMTHIRVEQVLAGYPIHGQDMVLHIDKGILKDLNGFAWTSKMPKEIPTPATEAEASEAVKQHLLSLNVKFATQQNSLIQKADDKMELVWLPEDGNLILTYRANIHPNLLDHWTVYVDAVTLEIKRAHSQLCSFFPSKLYENHSNGACTGSHHTDYAPDDLDIEEAALLADGATTANAQDLLGQNRIVNAYAVGTDFFMIDASRTDMFNSAQSVMPNEPLGVIWTVDGQNNSPSNNDFSIIHVSSTNNTWTGLEVSAHSNAGSSYEYFRQTFNRNSLNGDGGNVISFINITDDNGNGLDNAFWNGAAMFYGNGGTFFKPFARALDVAGHEMSHGVIQNTANLEYLAQSGAMNESFADIFGAMIDRDDWKSGEDIVKPEFFPTGASRDLSNPHNGGNSLNDRGWQPNHMSEYQTLPNTPDGDNGGVHVNSGIFNYAYYQVATSIGKEKAEQIYYKALRDYLVKSSQFIDGRIAVEKAATDLHGASSAEVTAVRNAFDNVGIGAGQGGDFDEDIETNAGDDFILATDEAESDLYWVPPSNPNQFVKLELPAPLSRPSFTDDGSSCVYVDQQNNMIVVYFDWSAGLTYNAFYIEENPQGIWRNVVISKDGSKMAYTTAQLFNEIFVFDLGGAGESLFTLYNPTSAEGIQTGDVLFADAMEWDYSGEYLMYDALNRIESNWGSGIEYWDISFLNVWDNNSDNYAEGIIGKLFNSLPENISIGNPSFAKNSPYIITFDFGETYFDQFGQEQTDYWVIAANIETGTVNNIYQNTTVGYPSYSRLDDQILFTFNNAGTLLLATIDVQPGDKTLPVAGTDIILINGAQKGVWFTTGDREFTATETIKEKNARLNVYPQPASEFIYVYPIEADGQFSEFKIFDASGKLFISGIFKENYIDLNALPIGTYMLELTGKKAIVNQLIVKM